MSLRNLPEALFDAHQLLNEACKETLGGPRSGENSIAVRLAFV
jgi:hypothetical protein